MKIRYVKRAKKPGSPFVFCMVYNEEWFLPHFLDHHRKLGIEHFVFYDDQSTDRTHEFSLRRTTVRSSCTSLSRARKFNTDTGSRTMSATRSPELEGPGKWGITLDADEFMILPTRFSAVGDLATYLETEKLRVCARADDRFLS